MRRKKCKNESYICKESLFNAWKHCEITKTNFYSHKSIFTGVCTYTHITPLYLFDWGKWAKDKGQMLQ